MPVYVIVTNYIFNVIIILKSRNVSKDDDRSLEILVCTINVYNYPEIIPGKKAAILVSNLWSTVICFHFPA